MSELALNDSLIDEYINYKFQHNFNANKVRKLLKYIQPFLLRETHSIMADPSIPSQLIADPLINIIEDCTDEDLVKKTSLKLMLTDRMMATPAFTVLNIEALNQKLTVRYSGIYVNGLDKNVAQAHIKSLLSDAAWVRITDGYIAANGNWTQNKTIIQDIVPNEVLDLTIIGAAKDNGKMQIDATEKRELATICANWNIRAGALGNNIHDRYIETNKVKILLSSGLYNLSSASNKDFTYVIEIK